MISVIGYMELIYLDTSLVRHTVKRDAYKVGKFNLDPSSV